MATPSANSTPPLSFVLPVGLEDIAIETPARYLDGVGASTQLQVTFLDASGHPLVANAVPLEWSSSRPQDIQVDQTGKVTALVENGYATIHVQIPQPAFATQQQVDRSFSADLLISVQTIETAPLTSGGSPSASTPAPTATPIPAPAITHLSETSGPAIGGTRVTLTGTGFTGATSVKFGALPGTSVVVVSDTQITVTAPAQPPGQVDVTVTAPGGTSPAADQYTYLGPVITGITPNAGPVTGGRIVNLTGTGFTGYTGVSFGGTPVTLSAIVSDSLVRVRTPAHAAGPVDVTITTPLGTSGTMAADKYIYAPVPTISNVTPNIGSIDGGTGLTLTGTGFTGATSVSFGGTPGTSVVVVSDTQITVTAPAHAAGQVDIGVTTPGGSSATVAADQYTYIGPNISSVSPNTGPLAGGTRVTLTGTGFTGASSVKFGTTPGTGITVVSDTQLTVTPPAHARGAVDITVTTPFGTNPIGLSDRFSYGELVVTSNGGAIYTYAPDINGTSSPLRTISGPATGLSLLFCVAVDYSHDEIIVPTYLGNSVKIFSGKANGDVSPIRTISGSSTGLNTATFAALDLIHDEIMVSNRDGLSITVYSRSADGDVSPLRKINGALTQLSNPLGLDIDTTNDEVIVVGNSNINAYSRTADGNVAPLRSIYGANTGFNGGSGVLVDPAHNELFVTTNQSSVVVFRRTDTGNVTPLRTIKGPNTGLVSPVSVSLDLSHDELYVTDQGANNVKVFSRLADGDVSPLRTILGLSSPTNAFPGGY